MISKFLHEPKWIVDKLSQMAGTLAADATIPAWTHCPGTMIFEDAQNFRKEAGREHLGGRTGL
jgi:hypothetical protein